MLTDDDSKIEEQLDGLSRLLSMEQSSQVLGDSASKTLTRLIALVQGSGASKRPYRLVVVCSLGFLKNVFFVAQLKSLQCLRLILRDTATTKLMYDRDSIGAIIGACDFANYSSHTKLSSEAIKCMVNFALRALDIERSTQGDTLVHVAMREANWGPLTLDAIQNEAKKNPDSDDMFALCRLLNMTLCNSETLEAVNGQPLVDVLLFLLNHSLSALEQNSHNENNLIDARRFSIAGDSMRMFFIMTQKFGPLSKSHASAASAYPMTSESAKLEAQEIIENPIPEFIAFLFDKTMDCLNRALLLDFTDSRMLNLQLACVTYALNLPKEQVLQFDAYRVLPHLMKICQHILTIQNRSASTSMLMLFTKIVRDEPKTRAIFMMNMFPKWKEVFEANSGENVRMPEQHENTPGKLVIDAMQDADTGLHFYANEFVFILCNENAGAFTKFVGFGPAAGHLAIRGLMNMGGGGGARSDASRQLNSGLSEEKEKEQALQGAERVTGWTERKIEDPKMTDMSPEDVAEWNELCDKMERLDSLGVIKMMQKKKEDEE